MAEAPRIKYCRCGSKSLATPVDGGRLVCPDCGEAVLDPVLALIVRQQREILRRLDRLDGKRRSPNGSAAQLRLADKASEAGP